MCCASVWPQMPGEFSSRPQPSHLQNGNVSALSQQVIERYSGSIGGREGSVKIQNTVIWQVGRSKRETRVCSCPGAAPPI